MIEIPISFNILQVVAVSFVFSFITLLLFFARKLTVGKRNFVSIFLLALVLALLSFLFYYKTPSGMGFVQKYGLPHDFYTVWKSFDNAEVHAGFSLPYFLSNIFFYCWFLFFIFTLLKKGRK
jgi:hypothetical protein